MNQNYGSVGTVKLCRVQLQRLSPSQLSRYCGDIPSLTNSAVNGHRELPGQMGSSESQPISSLPTAFSDIHKKKGSMTIGKGAAMEQESFDFMDSTMVKKGSMITRNGVLQRHAAIKRGAQDNDCTLHAAYHEIPRKKVKKMKTATKAYMLRTTRKKLIDYSDDSGSSVKSQDSSDCAHKTPRRKAKEVAKTKIKQYLLSSDEDHMSWIENPKKKVERLARAIKQEATEDESSEYPTSTSSDEFQYGSFSNSSSIKESIGSGSDSSWNPKKKKILRKTRRRRAAKAMSSSKTIPKGVEPDPPPTETSPEVMKRAGSPRYCLRTLQKKPVNVVLCSSSEDEGTSERTKTIKKKKKKAIQPKVNSQPEVINAPCESSELLFAPVQMTVQPTKPETIDTYINTVLDEMGRALGAFSLPVSDTESISTPVPATNEADNEDDVVEWLDNLLKHEPISDEFQPIGDSGTVSTVDCDNGVREDVGANI